MSNLQIFNFQSSSIRTVLANDGEIWFVAKDIADALGFVNTKQAVIDHCKHAKTYESVGVSFSDPLLQKQTKLIPESDVYRLTMRSTLQSAEPFQDWLAEDVVPSIRKTGGYQSQSSTPSLPSFKEAIEGVEALANYLRLPNSGRIALVKPVVEQYGIKAELPTYAIDAPSTSITGSSMPTNSATELLKEHGLKLSTLAFNKLLETNGFIETLTRKSSKGDKHYKSITAKGLAYGKNITSTSNTKETQPHWYIGKFSELLDAVMVS